MNRRKFINGSFAAATGAILAFRLHGNPGVPVNGIPAEHIIRIGTSTGSEDVIAGYKEEILSLTGCDLSYPVSTEETSGAGGFIRRTDFANGLTIFSGTCYPEGIHLQITSII